MRWMRGWAKKRTWTRKTGTRIRKIIKNTAKIRHKLRKVRRKNYECKDKNVRCRKETPWPESASKLYRPSDRQLSAKLVPNFAGRGCHVVSMTDLYGRNHGFLNWSRYFFFQVALQLYWRGWVGPVPDPLHLRKSGRAGKRTRNFGSVDRNSDH
jgi:hypothetical protein